MIDPDSQSRGWNGFKRRLERAERAIMAFKRMQIHRSGETDSVSTAEDSVLINVREMPNQVSAAGGGGGGATAIPFKVVGIDATNIQVRPGTINQLLPSNFNTNLTISGSGTEYVYLTVNAVNNVLDSATFSIQTTAQDIPGPSQDAPELTFYVLIAVLVNGSVFQIINSNLDADIVIDYEEGNLRFYRWVITNA